MPSLLCELLLYNACLCHACKTLPPHTRVETGTPGKIHVRSAACLKSEIMNSELDSGMGGNGKSGIRAEKDSVSDASI